MSQFTYLSESEPFTVTLNGMPVGGVESYRLRVERKSYRTQCIGGGSGSLLFTPPSYTITLSRFLPDRAPNTPGSILRDGFVLRILHKSRADTFTDCHMLSATERSDERGRILEELVCVAKTRIYSENATTEV